MIPSISWFQAMVQVVYMDSIRSKQDHYKHKQVFYV
jgi:hypothetical protein